MKRQQSKENPLLKQKYQETRNNMTKMMQEAETNYWKEQFNDAATSADFWKVVKKLKRKQKESKIGPLKNDEGILITDDREKAELMNSYFTTIGNKLSDNLNNSFDEHEMSYISRVAPTCSDIVFSDKKLDDQLRNLNPRKAAGHDDIGPRELKVIGEPVKQGLRCIMQKSIAEKKFPDKWKLAKLKSIFKREKSGTGRIIGQFLYFIYLASLWSVKYVIEWIII